LQGVVEIERLPSAIPPTRNPRWLASDICILLRHDEKYLDCGDIGEDRKRKEHHHTQD
jgi:hypothetical protein